MDLNQKTSTHANTENVVIGDILSKSNIKTFEADDLDCWFNGVDDKMVEIINNDLIKDECGEAEADKQLELEDDDEHIDPTEYIYVEDILNKASDELNSNQLIQYECSIAYFIQVLMEGSNINKIKSYKTYDTDLTFEKMNDIVQYLTWISNTSEILAKRINQELLVYVPDGKPSIVRSSYNFCTGCTQCKKFYRKHEIPNCKEHHYVHSLLKYDIDSVIIFLQYIIKNNIMMNKEELNNLYLSIKTICFVTRHMAKEISYIDYITKNNSETFHRNNPIDLTKKKTVTKKIWGVDSTSFIPARPNQNENSFGRYDRGQKKTYHKNYIGSQDNRANRRINDDCHNSNHNFNRYPKQNDYGGFKKINNFTINKPNEKNPEKEKNINRYSLLSEF